MMLSSFVWLFLRASVIALLTLLVSAVHVLIEGNENFMESTFLNDGELVTKIYWNNISAIQSTIGDYRLQQITDGSQFVQLWSVNNELQDCDYDEEQDAIDGFMKIFNTEITEFVECLDTNNETCKNDTSNTSITIKSIANKLPPELSSLEHIDTLVEQCRQLHERIRYKYSSVQSKRWKRADLFVFPGTNWCGSGSKTKNFKELGVNAAADRCCRDHDYCKHTIAPFSSKYHLFNYRFHTVSHCDCDERFRFCLKKSNTGTANLIGKLFFNVVKTKCFLFKKEKVCRKRSWWGMCLKMKKIRQAYFKDGAPY